MKALSLFLFIFAVTLCVSVKAQVTLISGVVTDASTGEPIPGTNVYLSGTTLGKQTDADGAYSFMVSDRGYYDLVASFIGYGTKSVRIFVTPGENQRHNFNLSAQNYELGELVVTASNRSWKINYDYFYEFFLGTGRSSDRIGIENAEVLDFHPKNDDGFVPVTTDKPLIVNNYWLGYRIEIDFVDVHFDPQNRVGTYKIFSRFTELPDDDPRVDRRKERNRRNTYDGSPLHFFRSLYNDRVRQEGFTIVPMGGDFRTLKNLTSVELFYPNNWKEITSKYKVFELTDQPVIVGYRLRFGMFRNVENTEDLSYIYYTTNKEFFLIDEFGYQFDPTLLKFTGKWGRERLALLLPSDYVR